MPEHVEAVIAEHPDVTDICVYGIPAASGAPGESDIVAAIQAINGNPIDPQSVFDLCRRNLEGNSVPTFLQFVEQIPKTPSEKNLSRILQDEFNHSASNVFCLAAYTK